MKKTLLTLAMVMFCIAGFSQVWEKYDGAVNELNTDLTLKPLTDTIDYSAFINPSLYYSREIISVENKKTTLEVTHEGYIKGYEWGGVIIYKQIYGVDKDEIVLLKIVDGKYTPPKSIPEKREFKEAVIIEVK